MKSVAIALLAAATLLADPAPPLPPAESARTFTTPDDLTWELVLAEPDIAQPVFCNFDERGRLWVVEYRQYPHPAGLKAVSTDDFFRTVYDKMPLPPPHGDKGKDRITIHEDTNGDGTFDKHTVFIDGLSICTAVEHGRGGHFVLNPPYLLFYADKNGDDVPDGDPQVLLAGFGIEDTHSVANSLRWGPDGWLYGAHGSTVTAHITRPGLDKEPIAQMIGQGIWRYHPETRRFEVFAEGGGNTFGVEFDAQGRLFSGHNGGDTRGFYYPQGAYERKGFEKHGPLSNPYAFGYYEPMAHDKAERFSHNFVIYEGGALPAKYEGKIFAIEPLQGRVMLTERTAVASTFRTHDLGPVVTTTDRWFRPVDIKASPDGAIYVCDLYERAISHVESEKGNTDNTNGRVWRLRAKPAPPLTRKLTDSEKEDEQLRAVLAQRLPRLPIENVREAASALQSPNKTIRQIALRVFLDEFAVARAGEELENASLPPGVMHMCPIASYHLISALHQLFAEAPEQTEQKDVGTDLIWAQRDMVAWRTIATGRAEEARARVHELCSTSDPMARAWTIRLLCDLQNVERPVLNELRNLAMKEENLEVRLQLAASARRLPAADCLAIVHELLQRDEDASDPCQPLMLWWAIEAKCANDREAVLKLFTESPLWDRPLVREHILERVMRRFAAAGTRTDLLTCARLLDLAPTPAHAQKLMVGFEAAFKGRSLVGLPDELVQAMARHHVGSTALGIRRGDAESIAAALQTLSDPKTSPEQQLEILQVLGEIKVPKALPVLLTLLDAHVPDKTPGASLADPLPPAIFAALQLHDDPAVAERVLGLLPRLDSNSALAAQTLLASRAAWSLLLARAVEANTIQRDTITADTVAKLRQHNDPALSGLVTKLWPANKPATAGMQQTIARLGAIVRGGTGDPYAGQPLFRASCAVCHKFFGEGGAIGPDLTSFQRDDFDSLVANIVNPSGTIREGYENQFITTRDGRVLTGFLADSDTRIVVLRSLDGQTSALTRADIAEMKTTGVSLMPEGLLSAMTDQQMRDFFAYLRISQPLVQRRK
jgi:putative membrane-bound dehydrogenase-like protein